jgi:hypothetical protein
MDFHALGKWLVGAGILIALVGGALMLLPRIPFVGRLPGDIYVKKDHFSFYFPFTTCLILSLLMSLLFRFFGRK